MEVRAYGKLRIDISKVLEQVPHSSSLLWWQNGVEGIGQALHKQSCSLHGFVWWIAVNRVEYFARRGQRDRDQLTAMFGSQRCPVPNSGGIR